MCDKQHKRHWQRKGRKGDALMRGEIKAGEWYPSAEIKTWPAVRVSEYCSLSRLGGCGGAGAGEMASQTVR